MHISEMDLHVAEISKDFLTLVAFVRPRIDLYKWDRRSAGHRYRDVIWAQQWSDRFEGSGYILDDRSIRPSCIYFDDGTVRRYASY